MYNVYSGYSTVPIAHTDRGVHQAEGSQVLPDPLDHAPPPDSEEPEEGPHLAGGGHLVYVGHCHAGQD